jgi:hypothetical protein
VVMYVAPRLGSGGFADLEARIMTAGTDLTHHQPMLIGSHRDPPEAVSS